MDQASSTWWQELRASRERLGITREELARRTGVSANTLRRWEDGTRTPSPVKLRTLIEVLGLPQAQSNQILGAAGLVIDWTLFPSDQFPDYFFSPSEVGEAVDLAPWPEFVINSKIEVVAANEAIQAIWGVDFTKEQAIRRSSQMNLLSVASDHRFADRVTNWSEVIATLVGVFKGHPSQPESLDEPSDYFTEVLGEFGSGNPAFLRGLIDAWVKTPPRKPKCRWDYRVEWRDTEFGDMRFLAIVSTASEPDGLSFNDWHPLDADTWSVLEHVKAAWRGKQR